MGSLLELVSGITLGSGLLPLSVSATVTLPNAAPIEITAVWLVPTTEETPAGTGLQRNQVRRVMAISRADVPEITRKTQVEAPEMEGGTELRWRVDGVELVEADHHRVILIPDPDD